jgi:hypothetical protein
MQAFYLTIKDLLAKLNVDLNPVLDQKCGETLDQYALVMKNHMGDGTDTVKGAVIGVSGGKLVV